MEELIIGDKKYIPSKVAAKITGYAKDYVGQLCREGRIEAKLVGRSWYILEASIREHRFGANSEASSGQENSGNDVEEVSLSTWEEPRYTSEEINILPELLPTSLINTREYDEHVSEVKEGTEADVAQLEVEEVQEIEEEIKPVAMHRVHRPSTVVSMDIKPVTETHIHPEMRVFEQKTTFKPKKNHTKVISSKKYVAKAIFFAFVILVASITVIGSGIFDRFGGDSLLLDYFGGIQKVQKP